MADATTAPLKTAKAEVVLTEREREKQRLEKLADDFLKQEFDPAKRYMFELVQKAPEREIPVMEVRGNRTFPTTPKKHKPYINIVLTSQIIWKGQRRLLRYYDGCDSIFADEQPKDRESIDQFIKQTNRDRLNFLDGTVGFLGYERMLLLYLFACSWNQDSPFRTATSDTIFLCQNPDKVAEEEASFLDLQEEARDLAKKAPEDKMLMHSKFLGIPLTDWTSGNDLTILQVRTEYRKKALQDPRAFLDSYGNAKMELKYYIEQALMEGKINNKNNPNKAQWKTGSVICDISGLKTTEVIADKLFTFSQTEEGEEFAIQLKALYNN